jgi:excisionase family DNA binding protein
MTQERRWLTPPQAAVLLEVSDQTVRDWIAAGRIPAIKHPSGQFRIRREDVEAILSGDATAAVTP